MKKKRISLFKNDFYITEKNWTKNDSDSFFGELCWGKKISKGNKQKKKQS